MFCTPFFYLKINFIILICKIHSRLLRGSLMFRTGFFSLIALLIVPSFAFSGEEAVVSLFEDNPELANNTFDESKEESELFSFLGLKIPDTLSKQSDTKDIPDTIEETIKQADLGNLQAQLLLGYSYLYGENGLEADYDKAFEYYSKAALQNDATGLNNLGSLYYGGLGVKRNSAKAAFLFNKAAELGNADAAVNLGFILISGNGAKQDKAKALDYFEKASSAGNAIAQFMTGYAYYTGNLRPHDYNKAAPLIKSAADAGIDEAQLVLADIYINGLGFPQNYNNAVKYLRLAASQGNTQAMMTLADILYIGDKYNRDIEFAHVLYNLAAVRGVAEAPAKRQMVESKMKINDILQAQLRAENFKEQITPMTSYIRQTFGSNIASFIK